MSILNLPPDITKTEQSSELGWSSYTDAFRSNKFTETIVDDKLFVAVGKVFRENKSVVASALESSHGREICIIHVHVPAQTIPMLGARVPISSATEQNVKTFHEQERKQMLELLDKYVQLCAQEGVEAHKLYIESESVVNGIVTLISQYKIERLVMGAAADGGFSRLIPWNMVEPRSKKANQVRSLAPDFCHIYFVSKGRLVYTRHGSKLHDPESSIQHSNSNSPNSRSISVVQNDVDGWSTSRTSLDLQGSHGESPGWSSSISKSSEPSFPRSSMSVGDSGLQVRSMNEDLYNNYKQAMEEAEKLNLKALAEVHERMKAQKENLRAIHKRRNDLEEELAKVKEALKVLNDQEDEVFEEIRLAKEQKASLESYNQLWQYEKGRHEMQIKRASCQAEELRKEHSGSDSGRSSIASNYTEFSYSEIANATDNFNPLNKIGRGGYGSVYRAFLRHTTVAIKVPEPGHSHCSPDFHQEAYVLSMVRHPNIVTLIGVCKEASALIYEYLPNGSLEDRLNCKENNTPPLSWRRRIQIAGELCSALIFLHSNEPWIIVHGDLKPANILLDAQFSCKLSDFGICRMIHNNEMSEETAPRCLPRQALTRCHMTIPKGTAAYIDRIDAVTDPEFMLKGELTTKSDIYSYGVTLLRLLTGLPAVWIAKEVKHALDNDRFSALLDASAGDWPIVQAKRLALLALRCCEDSSRNRPDIVTDIWKVIESIRVSCRTSTSVQMGSGYGDVTSHP